MDSSIVATQTRSRSQTLPFASNHLDAARPAAISVPICRREVASLGHSANFDGVSPLAMTGGNTPLSFFTQGARSHRLCQSQPAMPIIRVNSSGSNVADASFGDSSQPVDPLNTAMRMSDQSALNLLRSLLTQSPIPTSALPSPMSACSASVPSAFQTTSLSNQNINMGSKKSFAPGRSARSPSPLMMTHGPILEEGEEVNPLNTSICSTGTILLLLQFAVMLLIVFIVVFVCVVYLASSDSCLSRQIPKPPLDMSVGDKASTVFGQPPRVPTSSEAPAVNRPAAVYKDKSRSLAVDPLVSAATSMAHFPTTPPPSQHFSRDCDPIARGFMMYTSPARTKADTHDNL